MTVFGWSSNGHWQSHEVPGKQVVKVHMHKDLSLILRSGSLTALGNKCFKTVYGPHVSLFAKVYVLTGTGRLGIGRFVRF